MLIAAFVADRVREIDVRPGREIRLDAFPVMLVIADLFAPGTNRNETPELHQLAHIFENQKDEGLPILGERCSGHEEMDLRNPGVAHHLGLHVFPMRLSSKNGFFHGVPDHAIITGLAVPAAIRRFLGIEAIEGLASALPENSVPIATEKREGCSVHIEDPDIMVYDEGRGRDGVE